MVLCAFWSLAHGRALALATPIVAIVFCIAKLAVYDAWSSSSLSSSSRNYDHLAIAVVSLLTAPVQVLGVLRTVFTYVDPDATLAEEVEGEEQEKEQEKKEKEGLKQRAGARAERRKEKQPLLDDDSDVDAYRLLVVGDDDGEGQGPSPSQQQELQQQPPNSNTTTTTTTTNEPRRRSMLYLLYRYAQPDHGLLLAGFFFIILSSLFKLAIPNFASSLLTLIIEGATATPPTPTLHTSAFSEALFYFILSVLGLAFFTSLRIWATAKAEVRLVARLQRILFFAILRQDIAFYDAEGTGALTSRLTSDTTLLGSIFTTNFNVVLQGSINLLGSTAYLFVLDARLAGAYLALVLLFMVLTRVFGAYAKRMQKQIQSLKAEANSVADQSIALVRLVRAFAAEDWEKQRYDTRTLRNVAKELEVKMLWTVYVPLVFLLQNGLVLVVLLLGGYLVSEHGLSARSLTAFYFYSTTITEAMQSLADNVLSILTGLGAGEKIMDIISQKPTIPVKGGLIPSSSSFIAPSPPFDLRFEDVSLTYPSPTSSSTSSLSLPPSLARLPVLTNLHLHIKQGQRIAIVGLSGSGKSSLISLLLRFYQPTTGRILFGDHDIQTLDPRWLKAQLGVALQDPMLFGGVSLRENITYGLEGIEEKDVHQAARMAAIHDFILTLPQGYDTVVGERGVTLSGGERQRVGLARALLRRPKMMIFDECTSSLDSLSESKCQEALVELHRSQPSLTMLTIAHRLSTVVDADRILVMAKGKIVEEGTHAELLDKGGIYKELVLRQLQEEHLKASVEG